MRAVLLMMIEELDVIQIVVIGVIVKVQLLRSRYCTARKKGKRRQ